MLLMPPLVSIITPTYRHERFIGECIRSVQSQTYEHWEMLVVDDGSPDATSERARQAAGGDGRVRLFRQDNVGILRLHETYNFALARSSGDLVAVLEGDDTWEPDKLRMQVEALGKDPDAVLCWGDVLIANEDLEPLGLSASGSEQVDRAGFDNRPVGSVLNALYVENVIPATTLLIRRTALEVVGGFQHRDGLPLVDLPTILALSLLGPFIHLPMTLATWRWHPDQATKTFRAQIIERVRDLVLDHFDQLPTEVRSRLSVSRSMLEREYRHQLHRSYVQSGRYKQAQRKFGAARTDYLRALFYPGASEPKLRLAALAGIASSLGGIDIEWVARLLGRKPIS
jgi:glycosyltransferase involved in cell wall biosynthesis